MLSYVLEFRVEHSKTQSCVFPFCFVLFVVFLGVTEAELCFRIYER